MKTYFLIGLLLTTFSSFANNFDEKLYKMESSLISSVENPRMDHSHYTRTLKYQIVLAEATLAGLIYRKLDSGSLHVDDYNLEEYYYKSIDEIDKRLMDDVTTSFLSSFKNVLLESATFIQDEGQDYFITVNIGLLKQIQKSIKDFKVSNCGSLIF